MKCVTFSRDYLTLYTVYTEQNKRCFLVVCDRQLSKWKSRARRSATLLRESNTLFWDFAPNLEERKHFYFKHKRKIHFPKILHTIRYVTTVRYIPKKPLPLKMYKQCCSFFSAALLSFFECRLLGSQFFYCLGNLPG